jgi:hypothetical protein
MLVALARVYEVGVGELFEKAGYVDEPAPSDVDVAFQQVLADRTFKFGTRFKGELSQEAKRVMIALYERATDKKLLSGDGGI